MTLQLEEPRSSSADWEALEQRLAALERRLGLQEARAAALAESAGGFSLVSLWVAAWVITYSLATREILPP